MASQRRLKCLFFGSNFIVLLILSYLMIDNVFHFKEPTAVNTTSSNCKENLWQRVAYNVFVYSAYWEKRLRVPAVRIIAILPRRVKVHLQCFLIYEKTSFLQAGRMTIELLADHHGKRLTAAFLDCRPRRRRKGRIKSVVIYERHHHPVDVCVYSFPALKPKGVGVCVRPLFGPFRDVVRLYEFLEFYRIVGRTTHFTFRIYNATSAVLNFLASYRQSVQVSLTVLGWNLPKPVIANVWDYGSLALLNDCVYRHQRNQYVALVDIDEFIVPHKHGYIPEMIQDLQRSSPSTTLASFLFRNAFFCSQFQDSVPEVVPNFQFLRKFLRPQSVWAVGNRSKLVVRPHLVMSTIIHRVTKVVPRTQQLSVPPDIALLHHYRYCGGGWNKGKLVVDKAAMKFQTIIKNRHIPLNLTTVY